MEYHLLFKNNKNTVIKEIKNEDILDEIIIEDWFHFEIMEEGKYWIRIGDARVECLTDNNNKITKLEIERNVY